jgi:CNT family concentrative nucleoside transporter
MMAVYIGLGADPVAILATSVMAVPCSLYLSKLLLPELGQPETSGLVHVKSEKLHSSGIDAFATGASDGLFLALNVAAMLIAFLAGLAMLDFLLNLLGVYVFQMPDKALSLAKVFGWVFSPVAFLLGIQGADVTKVAELLGFKLAANEFIAYLTLKGMTAPAEGAAIGRRAHRLATYALTGFANFGSIGIQLGGIGAMAPHRRKDLAKLAPSALFVGFVATLVNASLAGLLMDE